MQPRLVLCFALIAVLCAAAVNAAPGHPRIFVTAQDLPRLRAMAADEKEGPLGFVPAQAWRTIRERADGYLAKPFVYRITMPGEEGGAAKVWEYTLSDQAPPRHDDYPHYPCWTGMFQEREDAITTRLSYLLLAHLVSGEARYLDGAKQIVFAMCSWNGIWTDPSYGYSDSKPSLDCGHAAEWIGIFYDWEADGLTAEERTRVRTALVEKALLPIDRALDAIPAYHNWNAVVASGLGVGATALLGEDPRAQGWIDHAVARGRAYFDAQGKDGGPMEGPMYGTYAADCFADLIWALTTAGVANGLVDDPYVRSLPRYCLSLMSPNNLQQPCFGDGGPSRGYLGRMMLALALRGDAEAAWYCRQSDLLNPNTIRGFIAVDPARLTPRQPTADPSAAFTDIGYAILRNGYEPGGAFLAFKAGPPTAEIGHNHYDSNSFLLNWGRDWIGWDPGYRDYFDPARRRYTVSTLGHSSLVVDLDEEYLKSEAQTSVGHDQVRLIGGKLAEFCSGPLVDYALGQAADCYNTDTQHVLDRFDRQLLLVKPGLVFIRDTIAAPEDHTYSVLLHLPDGGRFLIDGNSARGELGQSLLQAYAFSPAGVTLRTASYPGAEQYGPYLSATTGRTRATVITSVIVPRNDTALISNPGFEDGMAGWSPRTVSGFAENHVVDTEVKHGGKASGRIDNSGYYYTRHFEAPAGSKVTARWWARCTTSTGASSLLYYWQGNTAFSHTDGPVADTDAWKQYEVTGVVPAGTQDLCLALQYDRQGGKCWYDDVEVTVDAPVTAAAPAQVTALGDGADGAVAIVDGVTYLLLCGKAGETRTVTAAGHKVTSDAELAVVSCRAEGSRGWLLRGTRLEMDGKEVPLQEGRWQVGGG